MIAEGCYVDAVRGATTAETAACADYTHSPDRSSGGAGSGAVEPGLDRDGVCRTETRSAATVTAVSRQHRLLTIVWRVSPATDNKHPSYGMGKTKLESDSPSIE